MKTHGQAHHTPEDPNPGQGLLTILFRYALYSLAFFGMIFVIWELADGHGNALFSEGSVLEKLQFMIMMLGVFVSLWSAFCPLGYRVLPLMLASLCGLAAIRELDVFFDELIPVAGWNLPFHLLFLSSLVIAWKFRTAFVDQLRVFARHRSFGTLWAGFMIAIPFGQMIGHGPLMRQLFGEDYHRPMKRIIEESAETMGYLMILIGIFDFALTLEAQAKEARRLKAS